MTSVFTYLVSTKKQQNIIKTHKLKRGRMRNIKMEAKCALGSYTPLLLYSHVSQFNVIFTKSVLHSLLFKKIHFYMLPLKKKIFQNCKVIFQIEWFCSPSGKQFLQRGHFKQVNGKDILSIAFQNDIVFDLWLNFLSI